jgi:hypothetical protein
MSGTLETIVTETCQAFIKAKSDGKLDSGEVINIATDLAQKLQKIVSLSGSDKKALLMHILKKALDASGGVDSLPGFTNATPEVKQAFEDQLFKAVSTTIDVVVSAVSGNIDLKKPGTWAFCLPVCLSAAKIMLPEDQAILKEATNYVENILYLRKL